MGSFGECGVVVDDVTIRLNKLVQSLSHPPFLVVEGVLGHTGAPGLVLGLWEIPEEEGVPVDVVCVSKAPLLVERLLEDVNVGVVIHNWEGWGIFPDLVEASVDDTVEEVLYPGKIHAEPEVDVHHHMEHAGVEALHRDDNERGHAEEDSERVWNEDVQQVEEVLPSSQEHQLAHDHARMQVFCKFDNDGRAHLVLAFAEACPDSAQSHDVALTHGCEHEVELEWPPVESNLGEETLLERSAEVVVELLGHLC